MKRGDLLNLLHLIEGEIWGVDEWLGCPWEKGMISWEKISGI